MEDMRGLVMETEMSARGTLADEFSYRPMMIWAHVWQKDALSVWQKKL